MARRACLAIGVSTVTPPPNKALSFAYLDGAVVAARAIGEWALRAGFGDANVRVVDDGSVDGAANPVTRERVQHAVDGLFSPGSEVVEHLILAFCGHGLTDSNVGAISWLFSDSLRLKYRVLSDLFYTELLLHGVKHITLITDACREAPKNLDLMRLDAVRGIVVEGTQIDSPRFDRLAACQDGQLGYMVSDPTSAAPGKCVFSGVITDVLWGLEPDAIVDGVLTTATLGKCVRSRTSDRAREYRLKLNPQCVVDPEPAVLYDSAHPLPNADASDLQPWPAAGAVSVLGADADPADEQDAQHLLELVRTDTEFRERMLGTGFGSRGLGFGTMSERIVIPDGSKELLQDLAVLRDPANRTPGKKRRVAALVKRLEADAVADERESAAAEMQSALNNISDPGDANVVVWSRHESVWSREPIEHRTRRGEFLQLRVPHDGQGAPVLVELDDGSFAPVVPYDMLFAAVVPSTNGEVFQAYGQRYSLRRYREAVTAIGDFAAGRLGADSIDRIAGRLRHGKHADPMLGAICAYLYRAVADYDSIRRMAFFYVMHGQPVPFDIALLGAMRVTRAGDGALRLHVPAVKARDHTPHAPPLPRYVTQETPAVTALVGGRCPWLGLGWDYVKEPREDWAVLVEGLRSHADKVRRSGATVLPRGVARALAEYWRLRPF